MDRNHPGKIDQPKETRNIYPHSNMEPHKTRKVLDNRYVLHQSIGEGRYAK